MFHQKSFPDKMCPGAKLSGAGECEEHHQPFTGIECLITKFHLRLFEAWSSC